MHYLHRNSRNNKVRSVGFRARMKPRKGRAILNRKRRVGRAIRVR
jgi:ribosomal protein L34